MKLHLQKSIINKQSAIQITGSKSESNRLLLLQALFPEISIKNLSNSDDSVLMTKALASKSNVIDIHHAGTAMRFLTAFFSTQEGRSIELTGSQRMKERPIAILVDALNQLGADITYKENKGFPPLLINGKTLTKHKVTLKANVSSQYISALLLIASKLKNGLELTLEGKITSVPYIKMTLSLLEDIGVKTTFKDNLITVFPNNQPLKASNQQLTVESDWSSASYFYSIIALSEVGTQIKLSSYKNNSLQGDSVLADLYKAFDVSTTFEKDTILLQKNNNTSPNTVINFDLANAPDIAQTIAVTSFALGLKCHLTGLHTLKIKETDRLVALKTEIEKLGGTVTITDNSLTLEASDNINQNVTIKTYNDHRMAMAFAPLALKVPITIQDYKVVSKSYPTFWDDLDQLGFKFSI
ncbi:3-phosphoshikimate 1-carboxyvinyltransferase [Olleya aquimaris]|uniref:3-phosphoshikimate 1-carboxyvinyltransferase n=1 Tax=Olleya aquimaris TaxID=639310 RepID=A0A327REF9_9FLAO|nr:3-phosphoshikimate 1-carboxyvinyltransferase [Olleya aquimaris]RAJ14525.1 3-phosphoshikimate 1-carboxyvinyltransferase [Olleya aquimaris]